MSQPTPPYGPGEQQPRAVPAERYSGIGLIVGILGGAVALVLVACAGVGYFVLRSIPNKPATPLARTSTSPSHSPSKAPGRRTYTTTLEAGGFRLRVEINPARAGENLVHLYAFTLTGRPQRVEEWQVTASLPAAGIDPVSMPVLKITENHATGTISLPASGQWEFRFTLRTPTTDQDSVTAQVPIK